MARIKPISRKTASAKTGKILDGVEMKLGMVPNMIATMAQSEAAVQAYLSFSQALSSGVTSAPLREQIALAVSQQNECNYCVAAHAAIAGTIGLTEDEIRDARTATSPERETEAALQFARHVVDQRGAVSDDQITSIRQAGFGDAEIVEVIAHIALSIFTNYFNRAAQTEIDFPHVAEVSTA